MDPRSIRVRFSNLKHIARSPAHYLHAVTREITETRAMRVGFAVHAECLGGNFAVFDGDRRGNAWKEFAAEHAGEKILTRTEADDAMRIAAAVRSNPLAMKILEGEHEKRLEWDYLGRACQGHLDVLVPGVRVAELKVTNDASPDRFTWQAIRMAYHCQLAWYGNAAQVEQAHVVAVEDKAPHVVTVMELTPRILDQGRKLCHLWMERLLGCEHANRWPGYVETVVDLDSPGDMSDLDGLTFGEDEAAA